jgi:hypothetical protein
MDCITERIESYKTNVMQHLESKEYAEVSIAICINVTKN